MICDFIVPKSVSFQFLLSETEEVSWYEVSGRSPPCRDSPRNSSLSWGNKDSHQDSTQWTLCRSSSCPISSWRIWWAIFQVMCPWSSINSMVIQWSLAISSRTVATISWFQAGNGCPLLNSLSRSSHPPHFKIFMWDSFISVHSLELLIYFCKCLCWS